MFLSGFAHCNIRCTEVPPLMGKVCLESSPVKRDGRIRFLWDLRKCFTEREVKRRKQLPGIQMQITCKFMFSALKLSHRVLLCIFITYFETLCVPLPIKDSQQPRFGLRKLFVLLVNMSAIYNAEAVYFQLCNWAFSVFFSEFWHNFAFFIINGCRPQILPISVASVSI